MKNKTGKLKQFCPYLIVLGALAVATGALFFWQKVRPPLPLPIPEKAAQPAAKPSLKEIPGLTLEARLAEEETNKGKTLELTVSPQTEPVILSAFALRVTITPAAAESRLKPTGKLTPNPELLNQNWTFPITKTSSDQNQDLVLELSGAHVAHQPFMVAGKQLLATVLLEPKAGETALSVAVDAEVTRFWTDDAVRVIPVQVK